MKFQQTIIIIPFRKQSNTFQVFFRSDESNCRKIQGGAKLYDQGLLKECHIYKNNGFKCGESDCLPIEAFCGTQHDYFSLERICPGFHILNFNLMS